MSSMVDGAAQRVLNGSHLMESDTAFQPSFDEEGSAVCFRAPFGALVARDRPWDAPHARADAMAADSRGRISKLTLDAAREVKRYHIAKLDSLYGRILRPERGPQAA